ncbi:glycoside hydrolase family 28 protein [Silvibacterium dinghuense]|uniref:Glycoside hydrolase family 28 protein n=1 Tax=Silvibacterium dinghuense TaxID=1560006 RepID=A0A4Q1S9A6_9BACT|nr:glycosyl hydrolase family 28 protein [Silvibacterium dinghuense]RXS93646.1 glycoside hydrolase family 28 protein [Silvibacterium dinghuense]GGH06428.1 hypothetical protein GCM10011586_23250 [Silvibacterium dinghuense]
MMSGSELGRRQFLRLSALGVLPAVSSVSSKQVVDVSEMGARGDGRTLNTHALQRAIDSVHDAGGGVVVLTPGIFLSGGLMLRSRVTLHLEAGAVLLGSTNTEDYEYHPGPPVEGDANGRHLIFALDAEDIAVTGQGTIDGNGAAFWHRKGRPAPRGEDLWGDVIAWDYEPATQRRPSPMLEFARCRNLRIEGITLRNAAGWTLRPVACESVFIHGIRVRNPVYAPNTDGMDITACRNVFVSDCDIATGDDAICIKSENPYGELLPTKNITVTNCVLSTCCNGFKVGTATHGRVENIVFSNSVIYNDDSTPLNQRLTSGIALEIVDGGAMQGVTISNIRMENARTPLFIRLGRRTPGAGSSLRNLRIDGLHATGAILTSSITGLPGMPVEDIVVSNSSFYSGEHGRASWAQKEVPEQSEKYPEARMFGRLPASGLYIRHAHGIRLHNLECLSSSPEERATLVCDDGSDLEIHALRSAAPDSPASIIQLHNCKDVFVHGHRAPAMTGAFLRVSGGESAGISLVANDLSRAAAPVAVVAGAAPAALTSHPL